MSDVANVTETINKSINFLVSPASAIAERYPFKLPQKPRQRFRKFFFTTSDIMTEFILECLEKLLSAGETDVITESSFRVYLNFRDDRQPDREISFTISDKSKSPNVTLIEAECRVYQGRKSRGDGKRRITYIQWSNYEFFTDDPASVTSRPIESVEVALAVVMSQIQRDFQEIPNDTHIGHCTQFNVEHKTRIGVRGPVGQAKLTKKQKGEVWKEWNDLADTGERPKLDDWLEWKFGVEQDGSLKVKPSTFYSWRIYAKDFVETS